MLAVDTGGIVGVNYLNRDLMSAFLFRIIRKNPKTVGYVTGFEGYV
jgi:hypothetical protein